MKKRYDVVSIGHVTHDIKDVMGEKTRFVGGAAYFSAMAARKSGAEVLVITKVASSDERILDELRDASVDVINLPTVLTTSMHNIFPTGDMDYRVLKLDSLADPFHPNDIPDDLESDVFHIASLFRDEFPLELLEDLSLRGRVALDLQSATRFHDHQAIVYGDWKEKERYLPFVFYVKADSQEIELVTGITDRETGAKQLSSWGAREVVVTGHGEVIGYDGSKTFRAPITARNYDGRVGRGDTCFLAYIARRFTHGTEDSLQYAAALTSIKMERAGPFCGTNEDIQERMATQ